MTDNKHLDKIIIELKERAKELNCLYKIQELLNKTDSINDENCKEISDAISPGFQYPDICVVKMTCPQGTHCTSNFKETEWVLSADILVQDEIVGNIKVYYTEERPDADDGPFLKEERKLIDNIAERIGLQILHGKLKSVFEKQKKNGEKRDWWVVLDMLKQTDPKLLVRLSRKMVNYLCWTGVNEADQLLERFSPVFKNEGGSLLTEVNKPYQRQADSDMMALSYEIFEVAGRHMDEKRILETIQKWTKEDKSGFLTEVMENSGSTLANISTAIERYHHLIPHMLELSGPREKSLKVALIRRLLSDQSVFIAIAKDFIEIDSFNELMQHIIYPTNSHGKLGGKSAGLFLAKHILADAVSENELLKKIKIPRTWYLTSDGLLNFMSYNNLEEIMEQKYKEIGRVRQEYPYVVQVFKNSLFSPEIVKGLLTALEDLGDVPLIIRSSSLLEDRVGAIFAGKYKSLFIANKGTKEERLVDLMDAIAEVYASTFGPDPINYRAQNNLLDYQEEMGIMIQEVVGAKAGPYFFPSFAGVAFSQNEYMWSSRIKPEDGLVRLVPGLGTRAVDRLSNDYPVLLSPGQPGLRVNVTVDEIISYSPRFIDVINLDTGTFETIELEMLLKRYGKEYPAISRVVSVLKQNFIQPARPLGMNFLKDSFVANFEGLVKRTTFLKEIHDMLSILQKRYGHPVDIEFAHDGKDFYLLQCRSQSYGYQSEPAEIPIDFDKNAALFSANKYITNGTVSDISHVVYVDPSEYSELTDHKSLLNVGKAIGLLNELLPKRQFILMGPGRWGSRGDIKLGVSITYSEINKTAMLIEIAKKKKDYVPDLSFGTHFFQDLVEANIKYLPLYPDDNDTIFNYDFYNNSENIFPVLVPDLAHLQNVIKVIDISATIGNVLNIYMNADKELAVGIIEEPDESRFKKEVLQKKPALTVDKDRHWRWRLRMAEKLAAKLDAKHFGVVGLYIFGSTKNATAGPGSDIDLLVHFRGTDKQHDELISWLDGWSISLGQVNFERTGYNTDGLLDVHFITDEDISNKTSYAIKIGAVTDAARPLVIGMPQPS
ncbi:MAG: nucleotidyltransferase domain-containing protein [Bacteroidetes bacterium]|nr:nucleotidyltransferase domain-containing protein [Bacteroidota bacterium]MBL6944573.1 nucleotidyltransferase domain-containing protein [Bacteroidales bacterium]